MGFETIALAATIGGGVVSALGQLQQGQAASEAAKFRARVAERNAQIARDNAVRVQQTAQAEQENVEERNLLELGDVIATQAGSGLLLNSRTSRNTRSSARRLARLDALNTRQRGDLDAFNQELSAQGLEAESGIERMRARQARRTGQLNAFSSLIGSAGSAASFRARQSATRRRG